MKLDLANANSNKLPMHSNTDANGSRTIGIATTLYYGIGYSVRVMAWLRVLFRVWARVLVRMCLRACRNIVRESY